MLELNSLRNHLLIAMPGLDGSWFGGTVTYLCEHNADGAMGLVLNKPVCALKGTQLFSRLSLIQMN